MGDAVVDRTQAPEQAADFEHFIAELSTRFIHLPAGDVDRAIDDALSSICLWFDLDLAVLWQWSTALPGLILPTHYHYAEAGQQPPQPLDERQFPWCRQQMLDGKVVVISSLDDLPPEAEVDRESARLHGIRSNLTLPLAQGGDSAVGALGLNTLRSERDWPDVVVRRLKLVAQVITNALARKRADKVLRDSEERQRLALDAAQAGVWTLDLDSGAFWATPRARAMFGYPVGEPLTLQRFEASVHADDWPRIRDAMEQSLRTGTTFGVEYRIQLPGQAGERWISSIGGPSQGASEPARCLRGLSVDISERRRLEEELRSNEARLQAGADLAGLAYYAVDFRAGVVELDSRFRELLGMAEQRSSDMEALRLWTERLHPQDRARVLELREQLHGGTMDRIGVEYRYLHPTQGEIWIDHLAAVAERGADGRTLRSYGVLRDIGQQKRAELVLRDVSRRLMRAQEQERALIARELHDDLTQRLALLAIDVGRAEMTSTDPALTGTLHSVHEQLVRVSEDVHSIAYQLHPSILAELGLVEALRAEAERRGRQNRLEIALTLEPLPEGISRETELCLYRVAQEALGNIIRHARAHKARVQLQPQDGGLLLAVSDDGIGFDPRQSLAGRHLGVASMRERIGIVGGTVDIDSAPGSGTTVIAWAPAGGEAQ